MLIWHLKYFTLRASILILLNSVTLKSGLLMRFISILPRNALRFLPILRLGQTTPFLI